MPNPTDTAQALVEAVEAAVFNVNAASLRYPRSAHVVAMKAQLDTARAALLAHVAGLTEALSDAAEALERVRGESQHCDCYAFDVAQIVLNKHSGFAFATRPTEARDS